MRTDLPKLLRYVPFWVILISFLFPVTVNALTDLEIYKLLAEKSEEIKAFPFHVYIPITKDHPPQYGIFQGKELPISTYSFFAQISYYNLKDSQEPGELFATYKFSQGNHWKSFLLRVPGMYGAAQIDLWVFDTKNEKWLKPHQLAEFWGDAGYSIDVQTWIDDLNKDGVLALVSRTLETDVNLDDPNNPEEIKRTEHVYIWEKDRFKDETKKYLPKLDLEKYKLYKFNFNEDDNFHKKKKQGPKQAVLMKLLQNEKTSVILHLINSTI